MYTPASYLAAKPKATEPKKPATTPAPARASTVNSRPMTNTPAPARASTVNSRPMTNTAPGGTPQWFPQRNYTQAGQSLQNPQPPGYTGQSQQKYDAPNTGPNMEELWAPQDQQAPNAEWYPDAASPSGDPVEAYVTGGGDWGPFGSGEEGYAKWFHEFGSVHGRAPDEQDVVDFWDSVGFLGETGRPPTAREWKNRWYTGTWSGKEYADRSFATGPEERTLWSIYSRNPALSWWS